VEPKPASWGRRYATAFEEPSVASRYGLRWPYPEDVFGRLAALATDEPRAVLDAGCGQGDLARPLAPLVGRVDAVDRSAAMVAVGRTLPGGDAGNLRWLEGDVEDVELEPPYALVVAGESVHWFDWERALPRFARSLSPRGLLAILSRNWRGPEALRTRLREIYGRHGRDYVALDPVVELERRGLFERHGRHHGTGAWTPTLAELVGAHHSQSSFALERMRDPDGFDRELAAAVEELAPRTGDRFLLGVEVRIDWGRPLDPRA
jgi:SAM-dependent methyltransferase